jgi:hypothetical protein
MMVWGENTLSSITALAEDVFVVTWLITMGSGLEE